MIYGSNFSASSKVYIGDIQVPIIYLYSSGQMSIKTPAVAQPMVVDIKVVNLDGSSIVKPSAFTYTAPPLPPVPTVTQLSPNTAATNAGGTTDIIGSNLSYNTKVYIGGVLTQNIYLFSSGKLRVSIPVVTNPGVVDVTVVDTYGQTTTLKGGFTYTSP
jgi:IPT/TIG domain